MHAMRFILDVLRYAAGIVVLTIAGLVAVGLGAGGLAALGDGSLVLGVGLLAIAVVLALVAIRLLRGVAGVAARATVPRPIGRIARIAKTISDLGSLFR